jgi:hypothetical protein
MPKLNTIAATGALMVSLLPVGVPVQADEAGAMGSPDEGWRAALEIYGYLPNIDSELQDGTHAEIKAKDILESLDMTFQAVVGVRKGRWLLALDLFYADLAEDPGTTIGPLLELNELSLKSWVVNPLVSYRVTDSDDWTLEVLGGVRYFWLEAGLRTQELFPDFETRESNESQSVWDAIVGVRGEVDLPGKWYLPYRFDVGTGDSDWTAQVIVGGAYEFEKFDLQFGYRYWGWGFDDSAVFKQQDWNGVYMGAMFRF